MKEKSKQHAFDNYIDSKAELQKLPIFYRYFELYEDDTALDVENCNMVYSHFHQSSKHVIGYFFKRTAVIHLTKSDIIYKIQ